ncbi:MAG: Trm112 family protein [Wenzhouxiangellaceae bacterium]|nr:Trm112 family protein [Wenzhouxiangellaceae bacterium]
MSLPDSLLDILCCPVSHEPLRPLEASRVKTLNAKIAAGELRYVDDSPVEETIQNALITRDGKVIYRIDKGIPVLLPERGIGTTQLENG